MQKSTVLECIIVPPSIQPWENTHTHTHTHTHITHTHTHTHTYTGPQLSVAIYWGSIWRSHKKNNNCLWPKSILEWGTHLALPVGAHQHLDIVYSSIRGCTDTGMLFWVVRVCGICSSSSSPLQWLCPLKLLRVTDVLRISLLYEVIIDILQVGGA